MRGLFGTVGTVNRVFIAKDKHTNKPKGFAFVTFEHRSQTEAAIQKLNGYKLDHLVLKVEWTRFVDIVYVTHSRLVTSPLKFSCRLVHSMWYNLKC